MLARKRILLCSATFLDSILSLIICYYLSYYLFLLCRAQRHTKGKVSALVSTGVPIVTRHGPVGIHGLIKDSNVNSVLLMSIHILSEHWKSRRVKKTMDDHIAPIFARNAKRLVVIAGTIGADRYKHANQMTMIFFSL